MSLSRDELALFNDAPAAKSDDDWGWEDPKDVAAIIPPDAPANDASLTVTPPAKKRGRPAAKAKAESASASVGIVEAALAEEGVLSPVFKWTPDALTAGIRDQFAMAAIQSMRVTSEADPEELETYAKSAYAYADALLKARG